jgi:hypothetical protein
MAFVLLPLDGHVQMRSHRRPETFETRAWDVLSEARLICDPKDLASTRLCEISARITSSAKRLIDPFTCEKQSDCKTDDGSAEQARDQSKKAKEQVPKDRHLTSCIPRKLHAAHVHSSCIHPCTTLHRGNSLEERRLRV